MEDARYQSLPVVDPADDGAVPVAVPVDGRPYGVLGRKLGHSYTPTIYRELAGMDYRRFEREPEELEGFLAGGEWEGVNVTIPYKQAVLDFIDEWTPTAARMGNVNTITRLADGRLRGDNTDYLGFRALAESLGVSFEGRRALVLGHGGAGSTCAMVLEDLGAQVTFVGRAKRAGALTYEELTSKAAGAQIIVNATPVGMWPACPASPVNLALFHELEGVLDAVYNPARTGLMMQAEKLGIPHASGLLMLVAQAAGAVERYTGAPVDLAAARRLTERLSATEQNVVLIGMPGSGKTRVGEQLARLLGRPHVDIDLELEDRLGASCAQFIGEHGEGAFRLRETEVVRDVCGRSGQVVSCGGGVVTESVNYRLLHQNGIIVMIDRPLAELAHRNRPITQRDGVEKLARVRMPLYRAWADHVVASTDCARHTAEAIARVLPEMLDEEGSR